MRKSRLSYILFSALCICGIAAWWMHNSSEPPLPLEEKETLASQEVIQEDDVVQAHAKPPQVEDGSPLAGEAHACQAVTAPADPYQHFSPDMRKLVRGVQAGRPVQVSVGGEDKRYLFRTKRVTAENFQISAGPDTEYPSSFEVFEGRQIFQDGSLGGVAKMAVVNDAVSMVYSNEEGDFLIETTGESELVAKTLLSRKEGSTWGHYQCSGQSNGRAGVVIDSATMQEPTLQIAEIALDGGEEGSSVPEKEGARADHPYYRLGAEYDASLKDILILMVSSKSQTGTNLSSEAASYFSYAAITADVYERQLGLRYLLQELVLIPGDSPATVDDIEPAVNNPNDNGDDDLSALNTWLQEHRPQSTYQWGHALGWTLVEGDSGGTVGWAWIDSYGSTFLDGTYAQSVNEPRWTWGVHVHELGHNVGASHTDGGAMDPIVSRSNPREDFFTQSENGSYTGAKDIYNYMSGSSRNFVFGPADLRHPDEMPFGVDDAVTTAMDTPVTFNPLINDLTATPLFGASNNVRLVEVGQVFPKIAGTAAVSGDEITFTPVGGFTGNVWFSYTLAGDVGNGGEGWLHSADVVVTVGGNNSGPGLSPSVSTTEDVRAVDFSSDIRMNPLLNDEGEGRLWAGDVDALNVEDGTVVTTDGAFNLVSASVITGNGSVSLEQINVTRNGSSTLDNTGYLVYTPGINEPSVVEIQYTVEDADGNQSTGTITLTNGDSDGDGMLDERETAVFGSTTSDGSGDVDGDGVTDYFEYLYGSDETDSSGTEVTSTTLGSDIVYSWQVEEVFAPGEDYIIEISSDLTGIWEDVDVVTPPVAFTLTQSVPDTEGRVTVEVTLSDSRYSDRVFIRLRKP